eukprot:677875-Pyramimonas_sp.AAC.1
MVVAPVGGVSRVLIVFRLSDGGFLARFASRLASASALVQRAPSSITSCNGTPDVNKNNIIGAANTDVYLFCSAHCAKVAFPFLSSGCCCLVGMLSPTATALGRVEERSGRAVITQ